MRILHYADAHLGDHPGPASRPRSLDFEKALNEVTGIALAHNVDLIVNAMDTFDSKRPPFGDILIGADVLRAHTRVAPEVTGPGTHEANADRSTGPWDVVDYMEIPGLHVLFLPGGKLIETKNGFVQVFVLPHFGKSTLLQKDEYKNLTQRELSQVVAGKAMDVIRGFAAQRMAGLPSVLIAHCCVTGAGLPSGEDTSIITEPVLSSAEIEACGFDYVALGHIHLRQQVAPHIFYSGSLETVNFGEAGFPKGVYVVDIEAGKVPKAQFVEMRGRPFVTVEREAKVEAPWDVEDLYGMMSDPGVSDAVVRVRYQATGEMSKLVSPLEIRRRLEAAGAYYVSSIEPTVDRLVRARDQEVTEQSSVLQNLGKYLAKNQIADNGLTQATESLLKEVQAS